MEACSRHYDPATLTQENSIGQDIILVLEAGWSWTPVGMIWLRRKFPIPPQSNPDYQGVQYTLVTTLTELHHLHLELRRLK